MRRRSRRSRGRRRRSTSGSRLGRGGAAGLCSGLGTGRWRSQAAARTGGRERVSSRARVGPGQGQGARCGAPPWGTRRGGRCWVGWSLRRAPSARARARLRGCWGRGSGCRTGATRSTASPATWPATASGGGRAARRIRRLPSCSPPGRAGPGPQGRTCRLPSAASQSTRTRRGSTSSYPHRAKSHHRRATQANRATKERVTVWSSHLPPRSAL